MLGAGQKKRIMLGVTGASGAPYWFRLLELLLQTETEVFCTVSSAARIVCREELGVVLPEAPAELEAVLRERFGTGPGVLQVYGEMDWFSPAASGSNAPDAMIVCPCSGGALASIAHGFSDNLIERAADVALKEKRQLLLVPRETPVSAIHLENMLKLAKLGATILPAAPGFYHKPASVQDLVDFVVARILDHVGVQGHALIPRWGEEA